MTLDWMTPWMSVLKNVRGLCLSIEWQQKTCSIHKKKDCRFYFCVFTHITAMFTVHRETPALLSSSSTPSSCSSRAIYIYLWHLVNHVKYNFIYQLCELSFCLQQLLSSRCIYSWQLNHWWNKFSHLFGGTTWFKRDGFKLSAHGNSFTWVMPELLNYFKSRLYVSMALFPFTAEADKVVKEGGGCPSRVVLGTAEPSIPLCFALSQL